MTDDRGLARLAIGLLLLLTACATVAGDVSSSSNQGTVTDAPSTAASATTLGEASPSVATTSAPAQSGEEPVGLIALGHSGLQGSPEDFIRSGPPPEYESSWATGTAEGLNSIYQRMVELRPETEGHVASFAQLDAPASALSDQAAAALYYVPTPELAIIQTIGSDIRCDGTDDAHVPEFGAALDDALTRITEASPETRILMIGGLSRPALMLETLADLFDSEPAARAVFTLPPPCDPLDESGEPQPENLAYWTSVIESYEAEQQRACDKYPTCSTDEGALATFRFEPSMLSSDYYFNREGQRRFAEAVWPTVQTLLAES